MLYIGYTIFKYSIMYGSRSYKIWYYIARTSPDILYYIILSYQYILYLFILKTHILFIRTHLLPAVSLHNIMTISYVRAILLSIYMYIVYTCNSSAVYIYWIYILVRDYIYLHIPKPWLLQQYLYIIYI